MDRLKIHAFAALLAFSTGTFPAAAFAQSAPPYLARDAGPAQPMPNEETVHGHISTIVDADKLEISDDRGFIDSIALGEHTVINPSGTRLEPGMTVTIAGVNRGSVFSADQIDVGDAVAEPAPPQQHAPFAPPAQPQQRPPSLQPVAAPAQVTGVLDASLDSKDAYVGQSVTLFDVSSPDGAIRHATLLGSVSEVTRPAQGRNAHVLIHFDQLRFDDGKTKRIDGEVVSMDVRTKNNAAKEAGGALLGMLAGNAIAKTLFGIGGGGIIGAIGGYMIAKDNRSDVVIPANTAITVQLVETRRQTN